jgi:hypothetical protein
MALYKGFSDSCSPQAIFGAHVASRPGYCAGASIGASKDRYCVEEWVMLDGTWTFAAVFDGMHIHPNTRLRPANLSSSRSQRICCCGLCSQDLTPASQDLPFCFACRGHSSRRQGGRRPTLRRHNQCRLAHLRLIAVAGRRRRARHSS